MQRYLHTVRNAEFVRRTGRVIAISGQSIEASGPDATIGEICHVIHGQGANRLLAEVVGVRPGRVILMP